MADAPKPVTSPPALPWQPYDAQAPGAPEDQTAPETIYDAAGSAGGPQPWIKIQDGGAADASGKATAEEWPGDGTSDGSAWKQV